MRPLTAFILAVPLLGLTSCNIVGPAAYFVAGPGNVEAEHELDPARPTVVFIDDRASRIPRRTLRTLMAETAQSRLAENGAVRRVVDTQAAMAVAAQDRKSRPMSITAIGEAVGAEVVIYATVDDFTISPDGQTVLPSSTLRVKVIDVTTGERLWPEEREGYTLALTMRDREGARTTTTGASDLQRDLALWTGTGLAELFYDVEVTFSTRAAGQRQ